MEVPTSSFCSKHSTLLSSGFNYFQPVGLTRVGLSLAGMLYAMTIEHFAQAQSQSPGVVLSVDANVR